MPTTEYSDAGHYAKSDPEQYLDHPTLGDAARLVHEALQQRHGAAAPKRAIAPALLEHKERPKLPEVSADPELLTAATARDWGERLREAAPGAFEQFRADKRRRLIEFHDFLLCIAVAGLESSRKISGAKSRPSSVTIFTILELLPELTGLSRRSIGNYLNDLQQAGLLLRREVNQHIAYDERGNASAASGHSDAVLGQGSLIVLRCRPGDSRLRLHHEDFAAVKRNLAQDINNGHTAKRLFAELADVQQQPGREITFTDIVKFSLALP